MDVFTAYHSCLSVRWQPHPMMDTFPPWVVFVCWLSHPKLLNFVWLLAKMSYWANLDGKQLQLAFGHACMCMHLLYIKPADKQTKHTYQHPQHTHTNTQNCLALVQMPAVQYQSMCLSRNKNTNGGGISYHCWAYVSVCVCMCSCVPNFSPRVNCF